MDYTSLNTRTPQKNVPTAALAVATGKSLAKGVRQLIYPVCVLLWFGLLRECYVCSS